jgi:hypothetical protein
MSDPDPADPTAPAAGAPAPARLGDRLLLRAREAEARAATTHARNPQTRAALLRLALEFRRAAARLDR